MQFTNKHDQRRVDALKKTLAKAKEQADEVLLYLNVNRRPMEERWPVEDGLVHIEQAQTALGVNVDDGQRATDDEAVVLQ